MFYKPRSLPLPSIMPLSTLFSKSAENTSIVPFQPTVTYANPYQSYQTYQTAPAAGTQPVVVTIECDINDNRNGRFCCSNSFFSGVLFVPFCFLLFFAGWYLQAVSPIDIPSRPANPPGLGPTELKEPALFTQASPNISRPVLGLTTSPNPDTYLTDVLPDEAVPPTSLSLRPTATIQHFDRDQLVVFRQLKADHSTASIPVDVGQDQEVLQSTSNPSISPTRILLHLPLQQYQRSGRFLFWQLKSESSTPTSTSAFIADNDVGNTSDESSLVAASAANGIEEPTYDGESAAQGEESEEEVQGFLPLRAQFYSEEKELRGRAWGALRTDGTGMKAPGCGGKHSSCASLGHPASHLRVSCWVHNQSLYCC